MGTVVDGSSNRAAHRCCRSRSEVIGSFSDTSNILKSEDTEDEPFRVTAKLISIETEMITAVDKVSTLGVDREEIILFER